MTDAVDEAVQGGECRAVSSSHPKKKLSYSARCCSDLLDSMSCAQELHY